MKRINSALISVYHKEGLDEIAEKLNRLGVTIYSTGGTLQYMKDLGIEAVSVESITSYPSILGGRVKTLHPKVFGGILGRRDIEADHQDVQQYEIPFIDLVIVDLYPFERTLASTDDRQAIIEKIDIGGISLIRAAAKNFKDVLIIPSSEDYPDLLNLLNDKDGHSDLEDRMRFAGRAFEVSSHYDTAIFNYFKGPGGLQGFRKSFSVSRTLRYGENPHQKGTYWGTLEEIFTQLHGKEISFNNLGDIDAAVGLIEEFEEPTFAILKHSNACGVASRQDLTVAWTDALAGDPVSAFGGVIITNRSVDEKTASEINKLFFEVILAPDYEKKALEILKSKKNRIILLKKSYDFQEQQFKSLLNGVVEQDRDFRTENKDDLRVVTTTGPAPGQVEDLLFANKIVKHTKSNAIVLAGKKQLYGSGTGQTSRVDALKQAIAKAKSFGFDLRGAVMASDAFFPFADSVEIAHKEGINGVIQPGGSVRDQESVDFCNENNMSMVFTGYRHFKH